MSRFTFPHFQAKPKAVQPDYEKWQEVKVGMRRDEVTELLGQPREDEYLPSNSPYLNYGYIQLPFVPHPRSYCFSIGLDEQDTVFSIEDPFNGRFSKDGLPTTPELIMPNHSAVFSHYPRLVDIRWIPVSGIYPVTYCVELGWFPYPELNNAPPELNWIDETIESDLVGPYLVTDYCGASPGRIRVKAKNELGESDWSEYHTFRFTI